MEEALRNVAAETEVSNKCVNLACRLRLRNATCERHARLQERKKQGSPNAKVSAV